MKIYLIIPTYNEKNNIKQLIPKIFDLGIKELYILVVDDNSPDGTGDLVEQLKEQHQNLEVLHRQQKSGLGKAYVAGFEIALAKGADLIIQMDADLSHEPKYIPDFLEAITNYDLVLGSRYIKGGGVRKWNIFRRLISRFGNIYARLVLGMPFKDLTGGFKCYRRQTIEAINFKDLSSVGYNFQIETTYKVYQSGYKIIEVPIIFTEREEGKSKFNLKIILESFWQVLALRLKK